MTTTVSILKPNHSSTSKKKSFLQRKYILPLLGLIVFIGLVITAIFLGLRYENSKQQESETLDKNIQSHNLTLPSYSTLSNVKMDSVNAKGPIPGKIISVPNALSLGLDSDGCSFPPMIRTLFPDISKYEGIWTPACRMHDICFQCIDILTNPALIGDNSNEYVIHG